MGEILDRNRFKLLNHMYTMFVVIVGWMLFRLEELPAISEVFRVMFRGGGGCYTVPMFVDNRVFFWALWVCCSAVPSRLWCSPLKRRLYDEERISWLDVAVMAFLLMACTMLLDEQYIQSIHLLQVLE